MDSIFAFFLRFSSSTPKRSYCSKPWYFEVQQGSRDLGAPLSGCNGEYEPLNERTFRSICTRMLYERLLIVVIWLRSLYASREVLVIGGNFTLDGKITNIAEYDVSSNIWSNSSQPELYLYGAANGVVLDMVVKPSDPFDDLYVVGAFDTICKTCQSQYCSVGRWTGLDFKKVGEGLCPRANDPAMKIITASIGNDDLFVGGSFESRVWTGEHFVNIYNVARFDTLKDVWLPLNVEGGGLGCDRCIVSVLSLAWDSRREILYIGGKFNSVIRQEDTISNAQMPLSSGLAIWRNSTGITRFPGGGLALDNVSHDGVATSLLYDESTDSLFVSGVFSRLNTSIQCASVAAWLEGRTWKCLHQMEFSFDLITSMLYSNDILYVAGIPSLFSSWDNARNPYMIATYRRPASTESVPSKNIKGGKGKDDTKDDNQATTLEISDPHAFDELKSAGTESWNSSSGWQWLPSFDGASDVITCMASGMGEFENGIFIGGLFTNYPSILVWLKHPNGSYDTKGIGRGESIRGAILSISRMTVPDAGDLNPPSSGRKTILLVVGCMVLGIAVGVLFAFIFHYYSPNSRFSKIVEGREAIYLDTLAPPGTKPDMKRLLESYNRAMKSRHLRNEHHLNIIDLNEIVLYRIIGNGSFGRVWSGKWRSSQVAVKEFVFAQTAVAGGSMQRDELIEEIIGEAAIMSFLRHPKIVQLYGCSLTSQALWIVSELCNKGNLRQLLNDQQNPLSLPERLQIAIDVAEGLYYLHTRDQPIIHRDLKSHNIFVHQKSPGMLEAKIGDWGSARALVLKARNMTHNIGTPCWLAPEVIRNTIWSTSSDVYAFGIILWELGTGEEVHSDLSETQIITQVATNGLRPKPRKGCIWNGIMESCWREDSEERPSSKMVMDALVELQNTGGTQNGGHDNGVKGNDFMDEF